jgi:hypothetical protein
LVGGSSIELNLFIRRIVGGLHGRREIRGRAVGARQADPIPGRIGIEAAKAPLFQMAFNGGLKIRGGQTGDPQTDECLIFNVECLMVEQPENLLLVFHSTFTIQH